MKGFDVSAWQREIQWDQAAPLAEAVYIRSSVSYYELGMHTEADEQFARNWSESHRVGLKRGAYLYFHPQAEPGTQLMTFLRTIDADFGELPPAVDVEETHGVWTLEENERLQWLMWSLQRCYGGTPLIYTSPYYWSNKVMLSESGNPVPTSTDNTWAAHYGLWIAEWDVKVPTVPAPWKAWNVWQYSSLGNGQAHRYGAQGDDLDLDQWA